MTKVDLSFLKKKFFFYRPFLLEIRVSLNLKVELGRHRRRETDDKEENGGQLSEVLKRILQENLN